MATFILKSLGISYVCFIILTAFMIPASSGASSALYFYAPFVFPVPFLFLLGLIALILKAIEEQKAKK